MYAVSISAQSERVDCARFSVFHLYEHNNSGKFSFKSPLGSHLWVINMGLAIWVKLADAKEIPVPSRFYLMLCRTQGSRLWNYPFTYKIRSTNFYS